MTVKELKKEIEDLPDEMEVLKSQYDGLYDQNVKADKIKIIIKDRGIFRTYVKYEDIDEDETVKEVLVIW